MIRLGIFMVGVRYFGYMVYMHEMNGSLVNSIFFSVTSASTPCLMLSVSPPCYAQSQLCSRTDSLEFIIHSSSHPSVHLIPPSQFEQKPGLPRSVPFQLLNEVPHILHTRPQALANLLLHLLIKIQKSFNQLSIHEPERLCRFPLGVLERAVGIEVEPAERDDRLSHTCLQTHE
jgi:hypothetical protein